MFNRVKRSEPVLFDYSRSGMFFLLAGLVVVILPHIVHLPIWTSLTCLSLVMWRLLYDMRRLPLPNKYGIFLMFLVIVLGVLSHYFTIVGREAGTALLISLICLKLFEIKSLRDISVIVQLAFFAIVVTFLFSQSIFVALTMLVAVILLLTALISFHHAKSGFKARTYPEMEHLRLAVKMVLYAIPLAVIVFIFFPRTSTPLWGLPQDAFEAKTGLSDDMSPGNISNLVDSRAVAFRVQFESRIPKLSDTYWRGPVLWQFDGHTWSAPASQRKALTRIQLDKPRNPVTYTVTLEPHGNYWLFALDAPGTVPENAFISSDMQLLSRRAVNHLMRYEMTSYLDYSMPWINWIPSSRYLYLTDDTAPRARRYIQSLLEEYPKKADIVKAVLNRFASNGYYYTRRPPRLSGDPTDAFLFDTKRGYCEHFASGFTVLMRMAGIPSRVVTGYQGGDMNPLSNYMIVRQSDAHAWSEIYLEGRGWVRIDPTAVIPPGPIEDAIDVERLRGELGDTHLLSGKNWIVISAIQMRYAWDMVNNRWNQWIVGYSNQNQKSMFRAIGIPEITWRGLSYVLFSTLSIFTLIMAWAVFRAQRFKNNAIDRIYQQFLDKLRPLRIEKEPSEGVLSFSMRVARFYPGLNAELLTIAELYNQLRYKDLNLARLDKLREAVQSISFKHTGE